MSSRPRVPQPFASFIFAFLVQCRVITAVIMRELHTRYGRENIGYLWLIGEPMLLASVIGTLHGAETHTPFGGDMKPVPLAVLGYVTFILFRGITTRAEGGVEANAPLLYHRQVTVLDITLARALLEFFGSVATLIIIMSLLVVVGLADLPARPLIVFAAWGLMFFYALGHSLIIGAATYENRTLGRLVHPYSYFMVGLSAAFFQVKWIPHPYREWLGYIPLTSIFELVRYGWFESANLDYYYGSYLIFSTAFLIWSGLILISRLRSKIHLS